GKKDLTHVERAIAVARTIDAIEKTLEPLYREAKERNLIVFDPAHERLTPAAAVLKELTTFPLVEQLVHRNPDLATAAKLAEEIERGGSLEGYVGIQLGFPARWVKDNAYVSKLGGEARKLLAAGRLDVGHARELAKLGDKEAADRIAED